MPVAKRTCNKPTSTSAMLLTESDCARLLVSQLAEQRSDLLQMHLLADIQGIAEAEAFQQFAL